MITITPQPEDAMALIWARRRKLFTGKMGLLMWSGPVLVLFMGGGMVVFGPQYGIPAEVGYWVLGFFAWLWSMLGLSFALTPWIVRRRFRKFKLSEQTYTIDWDDAQLTQQSKNTRSEVPWPQFTSWSEDKQIIVLKFNQFRIIYIPKRVLDAAALRELRHLLEAKIGPMGETRMAR